MSYRTTRAFERRRVLWMTPRVFAVPTNARSYINHNEPRFLLWLDVDMPLARDVIELEETKLGRSLTQVEAVNFLMREPDFPHSLPRCAVIVATLKGEPRSDQLECGNA